MSGVQSDELGSIFERVLEQMAFAFPDMPESDEHDWGQHVQIRYEGLEEEGEVIVSASNGFLAEFASGMLGTEPEDVSPEDCAASLREIANVICGEIVHVLGGDKRRIRLGLPEAGADPEVDRQADITASHVAEVEGEPIRAVVIHRPL